MTILNRYLTCRWCPWKTLRWHRYKGRKKAVHGYGRLVSHISYRHFWEYYHVEKLLDEEFGKEERP